MTKDVIERLLSFAATLANEEEDLLVEAAKRIRELEQRVTRQAATVQARQESWHEMKQQLKAAQAEAATVRRNYLHEKSLKEAAQERLAKAERLMRLFVPPPVMKEYFATHANPEWRQP